MCSILYKCKQRHSFHTVSRFRQLNVSVMFLYTQQKCSQSEAAVVGTEKVQHGPQKGHRVSCTAGITPEYAARYFCFSLQVHNNNKESTSRFTL